MVASGKPSHKIPGNGVELRSAASEADVAIGADEVLGCVRHAEQLQHSPVTHEDARKRSRPQAMDPQQPRELLGELRKARSIPYRRVTAQHERKVGADDFTLEGGRPPVDSETCQHE